MRFYNSGYFREGDSVYHTQETCPEARRVRATDPEEKTIAGDMEKCETCRRVGEAKMSGRRYYNQ